MIKPNNFRSSTRKILIILKWYNNINRIFEKNYSAFDKQRCASLDGFYQQILTITEILVVNPINVNEESGFLFLLSCSRK